MRVFFAALMVALISAFSSANATPDWHSGLGYKARLVEGARQADGTFQAAFEIVLDKGWSTYWRVPGEHGIPPLFDHQDSHNVKDLVVHWPTPDVFTSGTGLTIGYKERVVLPFTVVPRTNSQGVKLNFSAFFGVCSDICVPADTKASLFFDPHQADTIHQPIIDEAFARIPGKPTENGLDVKQASFNTVGDEEYIDIHLQLPNDVKKVSVLTEGPQDWYFDPYTTQLTEGTVKQNTYMAKIPLYRLIRKDVEGTEKLRVTLVVDGSAIEKTITLSAL